MVDRNGRKPEVQGGDASFAARRIRDSRVTLASGMNPADANPLGDIHGGVIMKLVDEAGGLCAARHARKPVVTVAMDSISFLSPVHIGDLVTLNASVNWVGKTSMEVGIRVEAENVLTGEVTHTNSAFAVYVALDTLGRPSPVPPLILETAEEKRRWKDGARRQETRLERSRSKDRGGDSK